MAYLCENSPLDIALDEELIGLDTITKSFKPRYDRIEWINNEEDFKKWCNGETSYFIRPSHEKRHSYSPFIIASFSKAHKIQPRFF